MSPRARAREPSFAQSLLARTHDTAAAESLHTELIVRRPLHLQPTSAADQPLDFRLARERVRNAKAAAKKRSKQRPRPLSAKQKRALGVYEIPKNMARWGVWEGVNRMWRGYVREILGVDGKKVAEGQAVHVDVRNAGAALAGADLHGAEVEVVRSRCVGRVGIRGIVMKETKGTVELVTRTDVIKGETLVVTNGSDADSFSIVVPKEYTIFRLEIPITNEDLGAGAIEKQSVQRLVFELYGDQFSYRPAERATKKLKLHLPADI